MLFHPSFPFFYLRPFTGVTSPKTNMDTSKKSFGKGGLLLRCGHFLVSIREISGVYTLRKFNIAPEK